jgi:hypothetical protein
MVEPAAEGRQCATRDCAPAPSGVPHSMQNFAVVAALVPHWGQKRAVGDMDTSKFLVSRAGVKSVPFSTRMALSRPGKVR